MLAAQAPFRGLQTGSAGDAGGMRSNILVVLNQLEQLPSIMVRHSYPLPYMYVLCFLLVSIDITYLGVLQAFVKLLQPMGKPSQVTSLPVPEKAAVVDTKDNETSTSQTVPPLNTQTATQLSVLRLLELSQRTSDVMKASESEETAKHDPLLDIFKTFADLSGIPVAQAKMSIIPSEAFVKEIVTHTDQLGSELLLLPWYLNPQGIPQIDGLSSNPFEKLLSGTLESSPLYAALVRSVFAQSTCDVGLWIDQRAGSRSNVGPGTHLFFGFMGGPDDRATLDLVVQFCHQPAVTATVVRVVRAAEPTAEDNPELANEVKGEAGRNIRRLNEMTVHAGVPTTDTVYGTTTAAGRLQSETADNLLWRKYFKEDDESQDRQLDVEADVLGRIQSETVSSVVPLHTIVKRARQIISCATGPVLVMSGRSRRGADSHAAELSQLLKEKLDQPAESSTEDVSRLGVVASSEVRKSLGDLASAVLGSGLGVDMLVIQAGVGRSSRRPRLMSRLTSDQEEKMA